MYRTFGETDVDHIYRNSWYVVFRPDEPTDDAVIFLEIEMGLRAWDGV